MWNVSIMQKALLRTITDIVGFDCHTLFTITKPANWIPEWLLWTWHRRCSFPFSCTPNTTAIFCFNLLHLAFIVFIKTVLVYAVTCDHTYVLPELYLFSFFFSLCADKVWWWLGWRFLQHVTFREHHMLCYSCAFTNHTGYTHMPKWSCLNRPQLCIDGNHTGYMYAHVMHVSEWSCLNLRQLHIDGTTLDTCTCQNDPDWNSHWNGFFYSLFLFFVFVTVSHVWYMKQE